MQMRRITSSDVPALSVMAKKTFYNTFTGTCTEDDMQDFLQKYYEEDVLQNELNSGIEYYFAEVDGIPAGYISFKDESPEIAEIKNSSAIELKRLYVLETFHGKGLAAFIINFLIDHAVAQGYDSIFLGVWEHNFRAQKFYNKHGFVLTSHTHDFPIGNTPQTDVYMIKMLEKG